MVYHMKTRNKVITTLIVATLLVYTSLQIKSPMMAMLATLIVLLVAYIYIVILLLKPPYTE